MTDDSTKPGRAVAASSPRSLTTGEIWDSFQQIARDSDIDAEKMRTLYDLQKTVMEDQRAEEFNRAKFNAMMNMPAVTKDGAIQDRNGNVRSRYSTFKQLYDHVKPILRDQGLILDFDVDEMTNDQKVPMLRVAPILRHQNGYVWHGSYMPVPITAPNQTVTMTQAAKGAVETGKRVVLIACLGITEEEDPNVGSGQAPTRLATTAAAGPQSAEEALLARAIEATKGGLGTYQQFFTALTPPQKNWLASNGRGDDFDNHHARLKAVACGDATLEQ